MDADPQPRCNRGNGAPASKSSVYEQIGVSITPGPFSGDFRYMPGFALQYTDLTASGDFACACIHFGGSIWAFDIGSIVPYGFKAKVACTLRSIACVVLPSV